MGRRKKPGQRQREKRGEQQAGQHREEVARRKKTTRLRAKRQAHERERRGNSATIAAQAIFAGAQHLVAALLQAPGWAPRARRCAPGISAATMLVADAHDHGEQEEAADPPALPAHFAARRTSDSIKSAVTPREGAREGEAQERLRRHEPIRPATALSPRNSVRIWPRVAPSARRIPISPRRCVTAMAKEL